MSQSSAAKPIALKGDDGLQRTDKPHSGYTWLLAQAYTASQQTIPQYYLTADCSLENVECLRAQLNEAPERGTRLSRLSVNDFIIKASALACKKVPELNSSWHKDFVREYNDVNVGFAVQTVQGPMFPVVMNADTKHLDTISKEAKELIRLAHEDSMKLLEGGPSTFLVSSLAKYGIEHFVSMVEAVLPQSAILAVGAPFKRVVAVNGMLKEASFFSVSLSVDHRVVQGAVAATWLQHFKHYIASPSTLLD